MQSAYAPSKPEDQNCSKSWRDCLAIHPACNLFELISAEELRDLIANVAKHGLRDKVDIYFKDGKCLLVDGRNRLDAFASLGKKIFDDNGEPLKDVCNVRQFLDDAEVINFIISKNVIRRHLTPTQRRNAIGKLLKIYPEKSNRQIASVAKADDKTVAVVRAELEATAEIPQLEKTKGKDGKARPAKRKQALTKADYSIGEDGRLSLPDKLPVPKQATEKGTGSLNGSGPIPQSPSKATPKIDYLKALGESWKEVSAQIASGNQTMLKGALKNHLRIVKQTCQQLGV